MDSKVSRERGGFVVMLCTARKGGMKSVVDGYRADGIFEEHNAIFLVTHIEGTRGQQIRAAAEAFVRFIRLLLKGQVQIVHAHIAMRGSFWRKCIFAMVARRFDVPVIGHIHGSQMKEFIAGQSAFTQQLIRNQLEKFTYTVALSNSWGIYFREFAPKANVVVIPNYVRVPTLSRAVATRLPVQLLFLGIVGERKGIYDLLEAMVKLNSNGLDARLVIGGNGELEHCKREISRLGLNGSVELRGWVSGADKAELLQRSDIFVLPSHNEGFPMSILEAMSWGLPVVSTRVGGIPDLVKDGVTGLLRREGDIVGLTEAIASLIGSAPMRQGMGQAGRMRVIEHFSDKVVLPLITRLYEECKLGYRR